jgi:GAF domain-containing protein
MRPNPIPHYFNIFPTGQIPAPVCIGDLPLSDYIVSYDTPVEQAVKHLQANILLPGVIVMQGQRLLGAAPRHKIFERLGRRYGIELFLGKPISDLLLELRVDAFTLKSQTNINTAAKLALSRPQGSVYDPIIVEYDNGGYALLDMYVLLLSQSQLLSNMNSVVSSMNNIDMILASGSQERNVIELILESLRLVAPYHQAEVLIQNQANYETLRGNKHITLLDDLWSANDIYRAVYRMKQPLNIEDVKMAPAWKGAHAPSKTRSWMGVPIVDRHGIIGLLSLSRFSVSPFNNNEKEMAQAFARYINSFLEKFSQQLEEKRFYDKFF